MSMMDEYAKQIDQMIKNARAWRRANAGREAVIQFNYPPGVAIIQPISEAVKIGLITANDAGMELMKALWPWNVEREPTVMMVRIALEYDENEKAKDQSDPSTGTADRPADRSLPSRDRFGR